MKRIVLLPLLGVSFTALASEAAPDASQISQRLITLKQQQSQQLAQTSRTLAQLTQQVCQAPKPASSKKLQHAWLQTMTAWVPFQGEKQGPIQQLDVAWSMQFWPDKKNLTGRKVQSLQQADIALTPEIIAQRSVAVRGLGALELLIYEAPLDASSCRLLQPISSLVAENAAKIQHQWQHDYQQALTVRAKDPQAAPMVTGQTVAELSHQLSFINKKFFMPLGKGKYPKPYQAESWRSETSLLQLKTSFSALQLYFNTIVKPFLLSKDQAPLVADIEQAFVNLLQNWPPQTSLKAMLGDDKGLAQLYRLRIDIDQLSYLIQDVMPVQLKIVVGFNATDGD
ncbi:imelysin family protein [Motilimonas pumila]|uniref:Imelysin-like domain-containing protein n=1 Tax=Motilimonas pumila TaxID=2303987 RepID=A0A418YDK7_9GAMM|nr:imelysin family protein [Motilimonas pumila]RJG42611.1 hypothetical protein D1Z90_12135 [Motilimonas pumila]